MFGWELCLVDSVEFIGIGSLCVGFVQVIIKVIFVNAKFGEQALALEHTHSAFLLVELCFSLSSSSFNIAVVCCDEVLRLCFTKC